MELARLLDSVAPPDVAATFRLAGGRDTLVFVVCPIPRPSLLVAACADGGPPLGGKAWWKSRAFTALTGVLRLTARQAVSAELYEAGVRVVEVAERQVAALERFVLPGCGLDLSFDPFARSWAVGVQTADGWEWAVTP